MGHIWVKIGQSFSKQLSQYESLRTVFDSEVSPLLLHLIQESPEFRALKQVPILMLRGEEWNP